MGDTIMNRVMRNTPVLLICLTFVLGMLSISIAKAESAAVLEVEINDTLKRFRAEIGGGAAFLKAGKGVLVFPSVIKAGIGIGGEYGEGGLRVGGKTVDYYSTAAASIGFQLGAQAKSVVIIFMNNKALSQFRNSDGWKAGVDGSVALIELGAGGAVDTDNIKDPVVGFIFGNKGLMYNLTLEGSKFTRIKK
ncbi:MAG: lipoprotein [Gammaproteobacteria bacterium]|nr:MAG: lipoprotein [Gammaproteobacteria bacterium]